MSEPEALDLDFEEPSEDVAVVGMAGRFPGAPSLETFWENLRDGVESISFFSDEELRASGVDPALLAHPRYVRARGVLEGVELFDAPFFGFSPREAAITDPQHRILLECAWEALEQAGIDPATFTGRIGLYAGSILSTYLLFHLLPQMREEEGWQVVLNNDKDTLCTRVSYKLDLKGPSVTVQCACSTALVATHMARQSLLDYECDVALAGGISIRSPQKVGYLYQEEGIFSPDGHCRAFDAQAAGTVFSSGAGLVVLKRLSDALEDGDTVRAVLKGSAVNNDGSLKIGYTAPSLEGQAEVVARALTLAEIDPDTVGFVEAHGTGTHLGDPIELAALNRAFRAAGATGSGTCAVGSVKSNIGHLDTAAGIAGLIKAILALEKGQIPPTLHFEEPNPNLELADSPFYIADRLIPWQRGETPRRAGVSSLGIGGTNAHVVVEEAPPPPESGPSRPFQLLALSARTEAALESVTDRLAEHLRREPEQSLADVAFTLAAGRRALTHRRVLVAEGHGQAADALAERARLFSGAQGAGSPTVAFLFPGQGSQKVGMGAELYRGEPVFRDEVDRAAEILEPHLGEDLRALLYPAEEDREEAAHRLGRTAFTQPALFVIETALARLWMSWGIRPQAMLGHSVGEYVAAHLAGVMSLEDALALIAERGRLMEGLPEGAMMAVPLPEDEVTPLLGPELALAAVNAPSQCTVSGPEEAVEALRRELAGRGVEGKRLATSHAFHSQLMDPILEPFQRRVAQTSLKPPEIPFLSNVSGDWIEADEATDPAYWARHLRQAVRFADGLGKLLAEPDRLLLEVGPGRALSRLARRQGGAEVEGRAVASLRAGKAGDPEAASLLTALGRLWAAGAEVDWAAFFAGERRRRLPLPTYPFERQRHWVEPAQPGERGSGGRGLGVGGKDPAGWFRLPSWRRSLPPRVPADGADGCWLVFLDRCGLGAELAARLEGAGWDVVRVAPAGGVEGGGGEGALSLDPSQPAQVGSLVTGLVEEGRKLRGVLHLWSLTAPGEPGPELEEARRLGFDSLSALCDALAQAEAAQGVTVAAVSSGVQKVTGGEEIHPARATLLGWVRSAVGEGRSPRRASLDVALPEPGTAAWARLADHLLAEVLAGAPEPEVAYRAGARWVRTLEPAPLAAPETPGAWLQPGGRYLLTGGLDGLGFAMARQLAAMAGKAGGASEAPSEAPRAAGVRLALLAAPGQEAGAEDGRVRSLEELGAEVLVLAAQPAEGEAMAAALARIDQEWGGLDGVLYLPPAIAPAGGGSAEGASAGGGPAEWMRGALVLDDLLGADRALDLFLLFSWLEPPPGAPGRPELRAASALLDAVALARDGDGGGTALAIDWGPAVGFDTGEAFELLERILAHPAAAQIAVSPPASEQAAAQAPVGAGAGPRAGSGTGGPRGDDIPDDDPIARRIATIWGEVLGVDRIGLEDSFLDLGGDSLIALQAMARLRDSFPVELSTQVLFERPRVADLRDAIEEALTARLEELSDEEAQRLLASLPG